MQSAARTLTSLDWILPWDRIFLTSHGFAVLQPLPEAGRVFNPPLTPPFPIYPQPTIPLPCIQLPCIPLPVTPSEPTPIPPENGYAVLPDFAYWMLRVIDY